MTYVKKGAIIGGIIGLLDVLITIIAFSINYPSELFILFATPYLIISILFSLGICGYNQSIICEKFMTYFGAITTILIFIILGALIGFIVEKIKSKN